MKEAFKNQTNPAHHGHEGKHGRPDRSDRHGRGEPRACGPEIRGGGEFGGGRRARVFEPGDLKLVVLHIIAKQPSHGYDVIRAVGDMVGGDYTPSPGTVYPTLNLLEDMGFATSEVLTGGRKQYAVTPEGQAHLNEQAAEVQRLLEQLGHARRREQAKRHPDIRRAMENLKTALQLRLSGDTQEPEVLRAVADILDRAAADIGRL